MSRRRVITLLLTGLLPGVMGYALSMAMQSFAAAGVSWAALQYFMLLFWGWAGWRLASPRERLWQTVGVVHLPALALWVLCMVQILGRQAWFPNVWGGLSQCFFLPVLTPAMSLSAWVPAVSLWPEFTAAFLLMPGSFAAGAALRSRRERR